MAEIKKKRGRPPKKVDEKLDLNEKNKQITMSENENANASPSSITDTVSSMTINTYNAIPTARNVDDVSLEAVQQRWRSIFSKYSTADLVFLSVVLSFSFYSWYIQRSSSQ